MSSGVGYSYSYVDEAAAAARRARERIAGLEARRGVAAAQAERVGVMRGRRMARVAGVRTRAGASAAELEAQADTLEAALGQQRDEIDAALSQHWSAAVRQATAKARHGQRVEQGARPTPRTAGRPAADAVPDALEQARELAAAEARAVLSELGSRCVAQDLERLEAVVLGIAEQRSVTAIRSQLYEIRVLATSSVRRGDALLRLETERAQLRAMVEELPARDRDRLGPLIDASPDPASFTAEVGRALEAADARRRRGAVARVTADRLRAMGCAVTDGFEGSLVGGEAAVAPFAGSDYGLLVRFSAGRDRIAATVVRRDDEPEDRKRDLAAQREFCAEGLIELTEAWTAAGLSPLSVHRTEPGDPPPASFDARAWAAVDARARRSAVRQAERPAQSRARGGEQG